MAIDIFYRDEQKYLLDNQTYQELLNKIKNYLLKDKYFEETICNIYFDTDHNDLVIASLEKPEYKEKIRLRSYNIPTLDSNVFLEIKKKYNGLVNKRRVTLKLQDVYDYLDNGIPPNKSQIMQEIDYCFKYYHLKPTLFIAYKRLSYISKDNPNLRLTFDSNIISRRDNLRLDTAIKGEIMLKDYHIMEIKSLNSLPWWLIKALDYLKIYPTSYSKYGKIYEKEGKENV